MGEVAELERPWRGKEKRFSESLLGASWMGAVSGRGHREEER